MQGRSQLPAAKLATKRKRERRRGGKPRVAKPRPPQTPSAPDPTRPRGRREIEPGPEEISAIRRRGRAVPRPQPARPERSGLAPGSVEAQRLPRVVLAGRPNAGKSSLFNRLLGRRKAIVDPTPGVTRDVVEAIATFGERAVLLVDTGGFEGEVRAGRPDAPSRERLDRAVRDASLAAVERAALVVYVLDGKAGLSPADEAAAAELRRRNVPVLFVVNKLDSPGRLAAGSEFYRLGADELLPVSAAHGHGVPELVDRVLAATPTAVVDSAAASGPDVIRVAIVGRPNAGKSSLLNRLLGYERAIVDASAGTTRDALDTLLEVGGARYVLVDTAGIRRRRKVSEVLERSSVGTAIGALGRADVVVLVIAADEGLTTQDQKLAALAWSQGRGLVLVVNKWDLRRRERPKSYIENVARLMPALGGFPMLTISAKTGAGVDAVLPAVQRVAAAHAAELPTARLNQVLMAAFQAQEPPAVQGRRPRLYYATQVGRRPPTIVVFSSIPGSIHPSYHRYLENQIASAFRLKGTPLRLSFRARH
ncbi:MAG: ribosome biogenesis GTPase Der [Polyangiaceae bacterium UTPRO1]|jgi:GTP-binding protein|nr:ribosome biogenesis GTPase Der [Myxococcales bacterium]OQY68946.1 MAG: ribosome biogenesis GTPase Der [Polyangiaceae bacterium UTPRO1]